MWCYSPHILIMQTDQGRAYMLIGGPGHGEELVLYGQPETYDVDGELYLRTVAANAAFYRHSSLLPEPAAQEYLRAVSQETP